MDRTRKIILKLAKKIKKEYKPEKIILYGSYAWGNPTEDSDIDLFIVKDTKERPIDRRVRVRKIVDIREPIAFSPIVLTTQEVDYCLQIGDQFIRDIVERGEMLYG